MRKAMGIGVLLAMVGCSDHGGSDAYESARYAPPRAHGEADEAEPRGTFEAVGTNPYVLAESDPFSTFASDVDTASYDIFLREVEQYDVVPDPDSVRLEEWVNSFTYDYETPANGAEVPFAIDLEVGEHALGRDLAHLRVGIQAAAPPEFRKLPTNLVFLVDTSGSMSSEDKLPVVQELIEASLGSLEQNDTVSIVTYAGDTAVRLPPTQAFERDTILRVVEELTSGGGTNGSSGIHLAYEQAEAAFLEGGLNQVVLCTDGDFNIGITDREELVELIVEKRETGIHLTALGFGRGNLNDAMMERVSNAGNGFYSVITSSDHAREYATEDLLRTTEIVAKDLKIQLEMNPEHVVAYRLLGFENRAIADDDFIVDAVDAGEIGAGHRVTALYELVLAGQAIPTAEGAPEVDAGEESTLERTVAPEELVRVRVRWKDRDAAAEDPSHELLRSVLAETLGGTVGADTEYAAAVAAFAEILKESPYANEADLEAIGAIFRAQAERDEDRARMLAAFEKVLTLR